MAKTQLRNYTETGKVSWFGGPDDHGVAPNEGLALFDESDVKSYPELFLLDQPPGTSGVARRLNPGYNYCAMRWDYSKTSRKYLRSIKVNVTSVRTGETVQVQPVDWGPNIDTGRIIDLSPAVLKTLNLQTNDIVRVTVPLP